MMETQWYCCEKCKKVASYEVDGEWTSFPRGEYKAHWDHLTTGFKTQEAAQEWLDKQLQKQDESADHAD